ncbi:MASE1 domain-containing protein [Archangium sp.]|uniref:MASE1 domain-containing protein n=1 Tax=Archangium sp. TaxID=1872627 RepID=UPI00286B0A06|nr:MASE1 domain-containing protein [Archangium sp.]
MPESKLIPHRWPPLVRLAVFALVYGASAWLGTQLTPGGEHVSAMWPASGVALTALLLSRLRHWPALLGVMLVAEPLFCPPGQLPTLAGFAFALGNVLEALAGAFLLRLYAGFRPSLERVRDVLALALLSAVLSTTLSATVGTTVNALQGKLHLAEWWSQWRVYWVGDAMGVLLVASVLLTWATRGLEGWSRARRLELAALLGTLGLTMHLVFHWTPPDTAVYHPVNYLAFPFILWAALRFEARGTTAALFTLAVVALGHTLGGNGPFVSSQPGLAVTNHQVLFLQSFLAAVGLSGLLLAAALAERRHAQEKATRLNLELRQSLEELATTQQELVRRERLAALGELSASVAHEVRNPLAVIANSVAALLRVAPPEPDSTAGVLLRAMSEEVSRLDHLINDLLDFSRPMEPRLLPQSLVSVVDGALEASVRLVPGADAVRVMRVEDLELPDTPLDGQLLHLALGNLFTNALQAMPEGGTLRVELRREEREGQSLASLAIRDSGPGIPPEVMAHLFQPFYTTKASGTGLGLAIVRRIVEAHQGEVRVLSTVGQGTTFLVLLPLGEPSRAVASAA